MGQKESTPSPSPIEDIKAQADYQARKPLHIDIPDSDHQVIRYGYPETDHTSPPKQKLKKKHKESRHMARAYETHQPFSVPYSVVVDPNSGRPYYYPMGLPISSTYFSEREMMYNMGASGLDYNNERLAMRKPPCRSAKKTVALIHNNNNNDVGNVNNRNSVVISTFPDPQDDKIERANKSPVTNGNSVAKTEGETILSNMRPQNLDQRNSLSGVVIGGETISPPDAQQVLSNSSSSELIFNKQKDSHYVTYIHDPPRPPAPPIQSQEETTTREDIATASTAPSEMTVISERFVEVGEAEGDIVRYLIDREGETEEREVIPGEIVTVERTAVSQPGLEEQTATLAFSVVAPVDLVLCYDVTEAEMAERLKDQLERAGMSLWLAALHDIITEDEVADAARAVFSAQMMIVLMSESSVQRQQMQDLVSLATVVDHYIYPVAVESKRVILETAAANLKLQLTGCRWLELTEPSHMSSDEIHQLVSMVKNKFDILRSHTVIDEDFGQVSSWAVRHQQILISGKQRTTVRFTGDQLADEGGAGAQREEEQAQDSSQTKNTITAAQFWDQTFPQNSSVPWDMFRAQLRSFSLVDIEETLPRTCMQPLMATLRDGLVQKDHQGTELVRRSTFVAFCSDIDGEQDVWRTICEIAKYHQAVLDIFHKDSSVRIIAIDGIGSFGSPAVISGLRELLSDEEPVIRYLATASLSCCMLPGDQVSLAALMKVLDDSDWTVRRAACQAMARLGAHQAMDKLRKIWRNDTTTHVRAAAASALALIDQGSV
ncbi:hypothetical protein PoB_004168700 [Plakobranchus ocellatus]|uniref:TIR domain-containing protein n=1 Tax=Plakobranchus ocellatus TaxID=259542 RepID=A0AAV4B7W2_9GAST|nr:hypothetical protein PoB_004168700 [Plakobranchus ocellatus]